MYAYSAGTVFSAANEVLSAKKTKNSPFRRKAHLIKKFNMCFSCRCGNSCSRQPFSGFVSFDFAVEIG